MSNKMTSQQHFDMAVGLLRTLATAADPERAVGDIRFHIQQYGKPVQQTSLDAIEARRIAAHIHNAEDARDQLDAGKGNTEAQITRLKNSLTFLGADAFKAYPKGVTTKAEMDAWLDGLQLRKQIAVARAALSDATTLPANSQIILARKAFADLGDKVYLAYPEDVTSAAQMNARFAELELTAHVDAARTAISKMGPGQTEETLVMARTALADLGLQAHRAYPDDIKTSEEMEARIAEWQLQIGVKKACEAYLILEHNPTQQRLETAKERYAALGDQVHRAYPEHVGTADELKADFDAFSKKITQRTIIAEARERYDVLSAFNSQSPDEAVGFMRDALARAGVGIDAVVRSEFGSLLNNSTEAEERLDVIYNLNIMLLANGLHPQLPVFLSSNSAIGDIVEKCAPLIAKGSDGGDMIKYLDKKPQPLPGAVVALYNQAKENRLVRWVAVLNSLITSDKPHDILKGKVAIQLDAVGGLDRLDAAAQRLGIKDSKWKQMKDAVHYTISTPTEVGDLVKDTAFPKEQLG